MLNVVDAWCHRPLSVAFTTAFFPQTHTCILNNLHTLSRRRRDVRVLTCYWLIRRMPLCQFGLHCTVAQIWIVVSLSCQLLSCRWVEDTKKWTGAKHNGSFLNVEWYFSFIHSQFLWRWRRKVGWRVLIAKKRARQVLKLTVILSLYCSKVAPRASAGLTLN